MNIYQVGSVSHDYYADNRSLSTSVNRNTISYDKFYMSAVKPKIGLEAPLSQPSKVHDVMVAEDQDLEVQIRQPRSSMTVSYLSLFVTNLLIHIL